MQNRQDNGDDRKKEHRKVGLIVLVLCIVINLTRTFWFPKTYGKIDIQSLRPTLLNLSRRVWRVTKALQFQAKGQTRCYQIERKDTAFSLFKKSCLRFGC